MTGRDKKLQKAQTRVLFRVPFFAPGVAKLGVTWDDSIPTACTDGQRIRWSPEFMDGLTDDQAVTVLCHEVCHCLLGHLWRAPAGCDWRQWNEATDHAVNLMLKEWSEQVKGKGLADPFPFPEPADSFLADPKFSGWAEERIYAELDNRPKQPSGGGNGKPRAGSMPSFGDIEQPSKAGQSPAAQQKLSNDWKNTLIQSAEIAKGRGTIPASLARLVGEMLHPRVPWTELVRAFLREQCADDWDWMRPNPAFDGTGLILPSLHSERCGQMVFGIDSSGSIDHDKLSEFKAAEQYCLDELRPSKLVEVVCDAKVQQVKEYVEGEQIEQDAPGGGGTSFEPIFEEIERRGLIPKCLVVLTDLDGSFPAQAPDYPVLWCVYGSSREAPFGEVVPCD